MKIAISANTSWYLYNFRKNTILSMIEKGWEVIAISPEDDFSEKLIELGCEYYDISIDSSGANPIKDCKTFLEYLKLYRMKKPCVVLNFTPKCNIYGTLAARLAGSKTINNIAGLGTVFVGNGIKAYVARKLYALSQPFANKIFFQNEEDKELFVKWNIVKKGKSDRLPGSGVDLERFVITDSVDDGITRFLLVARMLFEKGVLQYVEAARQLKRKYGDKVEFNLLGFLDVDNPSAINKKQMENWVSEGVVNYLGVSDAVEEEIAVADCIALPSFYREGVPKTLLEAGAMGKPLVTTDNVGCRDAVDDGINGYLCKPRSSESLVDAFDKIVNMGHGQRVEMGQRSREKVEKEFDEKLVIKKYISELSRLSTFK